MPIPWLQQIVNPKAVQKSVLTQDILGLGIPLEQVFRDGADAKSVEYFGPMQPEIAARLFVISPVVRACADIIANYCSTVPLRVYRKGSKGGQWKREDDVSPAPLIQYVNPVLTMAEYVATLAYFMTVYENVYVAIEPNEDPMDLRQSEFCLWPMN